ncbi:MAG: AAA family ATPase, partial [Oceanospirillaceae bacterium]|nr:AAA family ATPase [Oceanospirillaceae bacterium]
MLHTFFIAPTSIQTGLTSISLGLIRALDERGLRVAFCKPVAVMPTNPAEERSTQMVRMGTRLTPPQPLDLKYAQQMISDRQLDRLMEEVIRLHRLAAKDADVIIIEG